MVWDFSNTVPHSRLEFFPMAGVEAGVVGQVEVNGMPTAPSKTGRALAQPSTWTYIFVAASFVYLFGVYFGMIRISGRR